MVRVKNPVRFTISMMIFLCLFILGGYKLVQGSKYFFQQNKGTFTKQITIDYEEKESFFALPYRGDVVLLNEGHLKAYGGEGQEKWSIGQKIRTPILRTSENILLLGDKDTGFVNAVDGQGNILWTYDAAEPIDNIVCNAKGFTALYTTQREGGGKIIILSPDGNIEGKIEIPKGHIMAVALSEGKEMLAVSIMNVDNDRIETNVILYTNNGKLLGGNKYDDEIIGNMFFDKENRLLSVGTKHLMYFDKEKGLLWTKEIPHSLNKITWSEQGFLVMSLINHRKSIIDSKYQNYLSIIEKDGTEINKVPVKGEILDMDAWENSSVAVTNRTLYFLTKRGKQILEKKINNDIKRVYMLSPDKVMLILKNRIEIVQWENNK